MENIQTNSQENSTPEGTQPQEVFNEPQGDVQIPSTPSGVSEGESGSSQQAKAPAQVGTPPPPVFTPDMIQNAVAQGVKLGADMVRPQQQQQPIQITPEQQAEFDKQFNVVRVTPDVFKSVTGYAPESPEQMKALENLLHNTARQAVALSQYAINQSVEKRFNDFNTKLSPIMEQHHAATLQKMENEFIQTYPDLKDYKELVKDVATSVNALRQQGKLNFTSRQEAFKFVADRARSLLNTAASTGRNSSQTQSPRRYTMTPTSVGGSPGSGRPLQSGNTGTISPKDVFGGEQ